MATTPKVPAAQHLENGVNITTANTNTDGTTGAYGTIATGAATGTVIKKVKINAVGTVTEGWIRLFKKKGTTSFIVAQIYIAPAVPGAKVAAFMTEWVAPAPGGPTDGLALESASYTLIANTNNGESFNLIPEGFDY